MKLCSTVALAAALSPAAAFVCHRAPPPRALRRAAVTTDDAIEQKLDSWLLDNLGS